MQESLLYLNLFSALYYLALIVYLFMQRKRLYGSTSLIGILAVNFYTLVNNSTLLSGNGTAYYFIFYGAFLFVPFFGVFFRAHVYKLLKLKFKLDLLNLSVVVLMVLGVYGAIEFYSFSPLEKMNYMNRILVRDFPEDFALMNDVFYIVMLAFFIETGIRVFRKPKNLDKSYSNLFVQSVKYIRMFWSLNIGLYIVVVCLQLFVEEFYVEYFAIPASLNVLFLFLVLNLRHYASNYAFQEDEPLQDEKIEPAPELVKAIEAELNKAENFRNQEFNLERLSKILDVSKNNISAALNRGLGIGFNDLLNANRIEFSKNELLNFDEKRDTIEGVGYTCGFNSKASFYRAFKKFTSMTPSEFMRLKK